MTISNTTYPLIRFLFVLTTVFTTLQSCGQATVPGCTDPTANNYNTAATVNNGSCTYNPTSYSPATKVDPITDSLPESSALQFAGNYLWSLNDRGGGAVIYRIDTITNTLLQRVYLQGVENNDWEAIAYDGTNLYIGDFGNNFDGARTNLMIYKFPFSIIKDHITHPVDTISSSAIQTITFTYSDQPQPPQPVALNTTVFDCEAMIVDSGKIHLFTKNWQAVNTTHYVINGITAGNYVATPVETLNTNYLVTEAAKAPGRSVVALFGYQNAGTANHFMHLLTQYSGGNYFNGNKRRLDLPDAVTMGQGEGLTFRNGGYGYISNEKFTRSLGPFTITVNQKLRAFNINSYIPNVPSTYSFIKNGNWNVASNWNYELIPPTTLAIGSQIIIDSAPGGKCILNVPYTVPAGTKLNVIAGKEFVVQGNLTQVN
jgi:hypothetical protein